MPASLFYSILGEINHLGKFHVYSVGSSQLCWLHGVLKNKLKERDKRWMGRLIEIANEKEKRREENERGRKIDR